jgi:quercetin dioxygenase-like cupin family protein
MADTHTLRPWPARESPSEDTIRRVYAAEGLSPYRWSNAPGDVYAAHAHSYTKVIHVVRGSITFTFPASGERALMRTGDRLDLPAGVVHDVEVGPDGVVCLEAHQG